MPGADTKAVAGVLLREVPLSHLKSVIDGAHLNPGAGAQGQGCGVGCLGAGADAIDRFGHSGLTAQQLQAALADKAGLKSELANQIAAAGQKL